jgi:uncharacterized protein
MNIRKNKMPQVSTREIAVVTGASAGIGKAYADRLAKRGYDLILVARRKDRLEALAQELKQKHGGQATSLVADLSKVSDLKRVADALANNERISVLVNNAGVGHLRPSSALTIAEVKNQLAVNGEAVSELTLAVLPGFTKRNQGTIINIGSVLSFFALPVSASYSATKAHIALFTLGLKEELANTKVRVQLVCPATTDTEIWGLAGLDAHAVAPGRVMSAEDCVDAALAGLDQGETVSYPSLEDASLWTAFDTARIKLFEASQSGTPASRYGVRK